MKTGRTWVVYTLIRLGIFAIVLAALLLTQMTPWIAAAVAAIISFCVSYIFLRKPREELANGLYEARHNVKAPKRVADREGSDEDLEDTVVDASSHTAEQRTSPEQTDARPSESPAGDRPATG